jgi:hypothetical protein
MCNTDKLYLAAAIQYDMAEIGVDTIEELAGYNRLMIKCPVSGGKNYFCLHVLPQMASGRPILFITSRKATVEQFGRELQEKADKEGFAPSVVFCRIGEPPQDRNFFYGHSWDIEQHLAEYVELAQRGFFRYIVMDECHSLMTDTLFASAPLASLKVLEVAAQNTTVILMSACPERIFKSGITLDYKMLDYRNCHKAEPQHVEIIPGNTATALLKQAEEDNKILYFVADTKHAYKLEKQYNEVGFRATAITSQPDKRKEVYTNDSEIRERRRIEGLCERSIREQERFFDEVDIVIATTRLREGVNIKDRRVKTIITALRDSVSLIQCSGRVRHGVENFYIIDGNSHCLVRGYQDSYKSGHNQLENYKRTLRGYEKTDEKKRFAKSIEKFHKGIVYYSEEQDTFVLNRFYMPEQEQKWADYEEWKADKVGYIRRVMEREQVTYQIEEEKLIEIIEPYCGRRLDDTERKELLNKLNAVLPQSKQISRNLKTFVEKRGFVYTREQDKRHYWISKKAKN